MSEVSLYSADEDPHHRYSMGMHLPVWLLYCMGCVLHLCQNNTQETKVGEKADQLQVQLVRRTVIQCKTPTPCKCLLRRLGGIQPHRASQRRAEPLELKKNQQKKPPINTPHTPPKNLNPFSVSAELELPQESGVVSVLWCLYLQRCKWRLDTGDALLLFKPSERDFRLQTGLLP